MSAGCYAGKPIHQPNIPPLRLTRGAATGSASTSGKSSEGQSRGIEIATPAAPDIRGSGSSGCNGMLAVPDTSGGPSSAEAAAGVATRAATSVDGHSGGAGSAGSESSGGGVNTAGNGISEKAAPNAAGQAVSAAENARPPGVTTNGGLKASALGGAGTASSNANSTPMSNTGGGVPMLGFGKRGLKDCSYMRCSDFLPGRACPLPTLMTKHWFGGCSFLIHALANRPSPPCLRHRYSPATQRVAGQPTGERDER